MDKNKFIKEIDDQISELRELKSIFGIKVDRFEGFVAADGIDLKIGSTKRNYYLYLVLSLVLCGFLYVAGFAQVLEFKFIDLSKAGLLIILATGNVALAIRYRIDLERLKAIKHLLNLKLLVENESIMSGNTSGGSEA